MNEDASLKPRALAARGGTNVAAAAAASPQIEKRNLKINLKKKQPQLCRIKRRKDLTLSTHQSLCSKFLYPESNRRTVLPLQEHTPLKLAAETTTETDEDFEMPPRDIPYGGGGGGGGS